MAWSVGYGNGVVEVCETNDAVEVGETTGVLELGERKRVLYGGGSVVVTLNTLGIFHS